MRLKVYMCCDPDGFGEEACGMLIAAGTARAAERHWRAALGIGVDEARCDVREARWYWPDILEPRPDKAGVWWPSEWTEFGRQYHGFGMHELDDIACEDCGEFVDPEDALEFGDPAFNVCCWCAAEDEEIRSLVLPPEVRRGIIS